ncbi:HAMP domain-containing protein [Streptomyces achromogenes]|uniref:HAMP domain-containing protein n=1 Tax=Streptomyces achromogenes TaxID=67255 RepID=A0ABU0PYT7_STRAH|nr:MAB_1171c family putative transporter [Streptomyces achromogenes]MDQ0683574.1 HAMP domain-containing protein [Streptomyces achromogenes]MDQ0830770.1 HAMP domain-containing protein [Streptomyces achromogenes]
MNDGLYISFWLPTVVLGAALAIKLPSIVKLWRDPLLRAVGGLLVFGCAVFVFAAPKTIAWTNRVTGVPNIAAPWVYSLLTALSASWLLLIIAWRNGRTERSAQTRRTTRLVVCVYAAVVVALWVLFALADVPVERIRDLDTYYANTPFMREEILLYLVAHTVACSVTARLVWNWSRTDGLDAWLRWGLRFLGAGYVTNLLFSAAKLTAVGARWTGHDLDWLNTGIAPSAACVAATLVAIGFIVPHAGQYLQERWRVRRRHRSLQPLSRLMRTVAGGREPFDLRATPELRLIRRETFIRDALLPLARRLDDDLRARAYDAAVALGVERGRAQALAAAVALLDVVEARERARQPRPTAPEAARSPRSDAGAEAVSPAPAATPGPLPAAAPGPLTAATPAPGPVAATPAPPSAASPAPLASPASSASAAPPASAPSSSGPDTTYLLREIQAVSQALRHPDDIQAVRALAAAPAESTSTHD